MAISFLDGSDKFRVDVYQDSTYIGNIRYTRSEGYILSIEQDVCLDYLETEQIHKKMSVMDSGIPKDR